MRQAGLKVDYWDDGRFIGAPINHHMHSGSLTLYNRKRS